MIARSHDDVITCDIDKNLQWAVMNQCAQLSDSSTPDRVGGVGGQKKRFCSLCKIACY